MITFNDTLDTAVACIRKWNKNTLVKEATLIRDVYGKVSLLMDNTEPVDDSDKGTLSSVLSGDMGAYFSGRVYWKKSAHNRKRLEEREKIIIDLIESERLFWKEEASEIVGRSAS